MELKNEGNVIQYLVDKGMAPEAIHELRRNLEWDEKKFSIHDFKVIGTNLYLFEAELNTGDTRLFYNGMRAIQVPEFRNYEDKGLNVLALLRDLTTMPDRGQTPEQTRQLHLEHVDNNTSAMKRLQSLNKGLFYALGGVLKPMLRGMDAATNTKMEETAATLKTQRWFPEREPVSLEQAAHLLQGRSVKVTIHNLLSKDELDILRAVDLFHHNNGELLKQLTQPEIQDAARKWERMQERQEKIPSLPRGWDGTRNYLKYDAWYAVNFKGKLTKNNNLPMFEIPDFDLSKKLPDFDFVNLKDPIVFLQAVQEMEHGREFIATTCHPDYPTVSISANAEKGTIHIKSQADKHLKHDLFRTDEAQALANEKKERHRLGETNDPSRPASDDRNPRPQNTREDSGGHGPGASYPDDRNNIGQQGRPLDTSLPPGPDIKNSRSPGGGEIDGPLTNLNQSNSRKLKPPNSPKGPTRH